MSSTVAFLLATVLLCGLFLGRSLRRERASQLALTESVEAGLVEPPSLHPKIDPTLCIGCRTCLDACPEGEILGLIDGKARLVEPTRCIGHGACQSACGANAIQLVFGTEQRGIDIPNVSPEFETNVPGVFIAGELGGMGLIRNAVEQGRQAIDSVRRRLEVGAAGGGDLLDVLIVGAGPAGFSASLAAMEHGMRFETVEQDSLGGTVSHYPRGKLVMTAPVQLPMVGKVRLTETSKEELLEFWQDVERRTGVSIRYGERVEEVRPVAGGFQVRTSEGVHATRAVLLAIGRRGTPRRLGVPGEDDPRVVYRLIEPEQYRGRHVLVVGGGDSALEAAVRLAEQPGTTVSLSYRSAAFSRAKVKNRERVAEAERAGRLKVLLSSTVVRIARDHVQLRWNGEDLRLVNEDVIICAGGVLPTPFLEGIGIEIETKHGTA